MTLANGILDRIGVLPAERGLFGWAGLCLLMVGASGFGLMNASETLFLKRVGVERIPLVLLASSGLLVVTTGLVGRIASRDPQRWLPWILGVVGCALLPFIVLTGSQSPLVLGAFVLISRQVLAVCLLAFWLAMGTLVPTRRAKQLFAPLAAGITVGGIFGSFGADPVSRLVGIEGLVALGAVTLGAAAVAGRRLRTSGTRRLERDSRTRGSSTLSDGGTLWGLLRTSRLFRLLSVALLCGGAMSPVLYFEFTSVLDAATQGPDGEQRLLFLYSQFRGWLNVAILVSQLWLSAKLYRNIGLPLSMSLWPAAYLLGFVWIGLDFALFAAFATFGTARLAEDGISDSAARVIYNLFPDATRAQATGLLEGPINRLGGVLGNSFVLGAIAIGATRSVAWAALPIAAIWFVSSLVLRHAYPSLLLRASAEHGLSSAGIDRATLLDRGTLRRLAAELLDPDPRVCRAALALVVDGEPQRVVPILAEALEKAPPSNRSLLVEALHRLVDPLAPGAARSDEAAESLARILRTKSALTPELRADLLCVYARLSSGEETPPALARDSMDLLGRALGDPEAPVRLAAIAELHRRGAPPPGLPDLDALLTGALSASDALIRRAGRMELRAILMVSARGERWVERLCMLAGYLGQRADRVETASALREVARHHGAHAHAIAADVQKYLEDRDPQVRGALLAVAGHAGLAEEAPRLVSALGARDREVAEGAREGLLALGATATLPLLVGMDLGGVAQREAVVALLRELETDSETLDALRTTQLTTIHETRLLAAAVEPLEGGLASLLQRRLRERVSEGLGALLDLIAALHDEPRLAELERRFRRSAEGRERDLLIEAIETVLDRSERDVLLPLLEPGAPSEQAEHAAALLGRPIPESEAALEELGASSDPTLRRLAAALSLEATGAIGDAPQMPSAMQIAVLLQDVPAFDRLSTQQLIGLAEQLQEQKIGAGERVYAAGDEGLGMYFVMEGEIELRRGELILERVARGSFFGELSPLDGVPRSSDAVASSESRLLWLDRDDLLPLLEDAPSLAVGLAQSLSARVRRLEDRLSEVASSTGEQA